MIVKKFFKSVVLLMWSVSVLLAGVVIHKETSSLWAAIFIVLLIYGFALMDYLYELRHKEQKDLLFKTIDTIKTMNDRMNELTNVIKIMNGG